MKAREIADLVGGELRGDGDVEITSVADIGTASPGQIAFFDKNGELPKTAASCVIVAQQAETQAAVPTITVNNPKPAFARAAAALHPRKQRQPEIHPSAVISDTAKPGINVFVGAFVCIGENSVVGDDTQLRTGVKIGDGVTVGRNCIFHPNVFVEDGCTIGDNVVLHAGVVIGADGFGYVRNDFTTRSIDHPAAEAAAPLLKPGGELLKFPQVGSVVIENDVEIGANTCIDRGALKDTRIGEGTKIDNLCQIAHNVQIGKRCIIAAMSGISGSSVLEDDVVLAGQVGIADHVVLKSGVTIGAKSAVFPNKIVHAGFWAGIPVQPVKDYKRQTALLNGLERLSERVRKLSDEVKKKGF